MPLHKPCNEYKTYGLIGYPLGHSFSQKFFTNKFQQEHIAAEYLNFEIDDIGGLQKVLSDYPSLVGFNVTIPYKQAVMPFLDAISTEAREIGAVNVVKVNKDEKGRPALTGFNTDVTGFVESIRPLLTPQLHKHALVLGTGGASKAVVYGLRSLGIEPQYVSRTANPHTSAIAYHQLDDEIMATHKVIVNCTPLGMYPKVDAYPDIPYGLITPNHVCFDLVYNPEVTKFMQLAMAQGAKVKNGLEMLHIQALEAYKIWNTPIVGVEKSVELK